MAFSSNATISAPIGENAACEPASPVRLHGSRLAGNPSGQHAATISQTIVRGVVRTTDFALLTLIGLVIALVHVTDVDALQSPLYLLILPLVGVATVIILQLAGLYSLHALSARIRHLPALMLGWTLPFIAVVAGLFFLKIGAEISRYWLACWYATGAAVLIADRLVVSSLLRSWSKSGRLFQRAVIYGAGPLTERLIAQIEADRDPLIRIAGVFDDRNTDRAARMISGYPRLGGVHELVAMSRTSRLDLIIVALPLAAEDRLSRVVRQLSVLPVDIKMPAGVTGVRFSPRMYSHVGQIAMIDLFDKPIADWDVVSKWLFDKIIGMLALVLLAPVMAIVALAVKLDSPGPVLFRQKRYGFNNDVIEVFKFRSMYADRCDDKAIQLVTRGDARVTRVGRIIRKTSLDELPQLFNVLLGNLSLVGPRPHAMAAKAGTHLYDDVVDGYFARHKVKPGITGWAQINGWRGETDTEDKIQKRVAHDLFYIENWSPVLDLYILLKTPASLLRTRDTY